MSNEEQEDYNKLNSEEMKNFFQDTKIEFDPSKKITEKQFNESIPKLIKPNINIENYSFGVEEEYVPKVSDPYKRLLQLKTELLENKSDIDEIVAKYNDLSTKINTSDINNYTLLYSKAQNYKNKIDSFIDYDIIKKKNKGYDSDSESDEELDEQKKEEKAKENQKKNEEKKQNILKKREEEEKKLKELEEDANIKFIDIDNISSINEKYSILANNLLSRLNIINSDLNLNMKYKVCSNPDYNLNLLRQRILEIEKELNKIENIIGDYDFNLHKSTIFGSLKHLLKLNSDASKNKEQIFFRYENSRGYEAIITKFTGEEDNMKLIKIYKKMCDVYMWYLLYKKLGDVIPYLKKRINAINSIILNSEQFDYDIKQLNELIKKNEGNYEILRFKYLQTLESFSNLEEILKEVNNLDTIVNKNI